MCIFFSFSDPDLSAAGMAEVFPEGVFQMFRRVGYRSPKILIIFCKAYIANILMLDRECLEFRVIEDFGYFPCAVSPEVEENHRIPFFHPFIAFHHRRKDEFIRQAIPILAFQGIHGTVKTSAPANSHSKIAQFNPIPALIPVHGIVSALDGAKSPQFQSVHKLFHALDIGSSRFWWHITAIKKAMDPDFFNTQVPGHLHEGFQMI